MSSTSSLRGLNTTHASVTGSSLFDRTLPSTRAETNSYLPRPLPPYRSPFIDVRKNKEAGSHTSRNYWFSDQTSKLIPTRALRTKPFLERPNSSSFHHLDDRCPNGVTGHAFRPHLQKLHSRYSKLPGYTPRNSEPRALSDFSDVTRARCEKPWKIVGNNSALDLDLKNEGRSSSCLSELRPGVSLWEQDALTPEWLGENLKIKSDIVEEAPREDSERSFEEEGAICVEFQPRDNERSPSLLATLVRRKEKPSLRGSLLNVRKPTLRERFGMHKREVMDRELSFDEVTGRKEKDLQEVQLSNTDTISAVRPNAHGERTKRQSFWWRFLGGTV